MIPTPGGSSAPNQPAKPAGYYDSDRPDICALVPAHAQIILEIGCGSGRVGEALKASGRRQVIGVELEPAIAELARPRLDQVLVGDVESMVLPFPAGTFDCIICGEVLEHLRDPWTMLRRVRELLRPQGVLIASFPNVANIGIIRDLVARRWTYQDAGILDRTHLRFFTKAEFAAALEQAGLRAEQWLTIPEDPLPANVPRIQDEDQRLNLAIDSFRIDGLTLDQVTEFFATQFLVVARPPATPAQPRPGTPPGVPMADLPTRVAPPVGIPHLASPGIPHTAIVIVTYNSRETLPGCLFTLKENTPEPYTVAIVDNASTDGTREYLEAFQRLNPDAVVLLNTGNSGFARAANQGIRACRWDQVVVLNPDTQVAPGWLSRMTAYVRGRPDIGAVGPTSNYAWGAQNLANYLPPSLCNGKTPAQIAELLAARQGGRCILTKMLTFWCTLFPGAVLRRMGLLDEDFFFSHEDLEYSLRLTRAGYWLAVAGDAFVYHAGGKSRETLADGKSDELTFAAARVLYRKLEAIFGAGKIPTSTELWGSDLYCFDPKGNLKPQYQKGARQGLTIG